MSTRSPLLLLASLALACTSIEGREPASPTEFAPPPPPIGGTSTATDPLTASDVRVAISSVMVEGDCPELSPPATPPSPTQAPMRRPPSDSPPGVVASGFRASCQQSMMQLAFDNVGKRDAAVRIEAVRMIDVTTDRSVAPLVAREPTAWSDAGYGAWDQRVLVGAQVNTSYELSAPDWGKVQGAIGGADSQTRAFLLEVEVGIDGVTTTVRSPEFTRPPRHISPPT